MYARQHGGEYAESGRLTHAFLSARRDRERDVGSEPFLVLSVRTTRALPALRARALEQQVITAAAPGDPGEHAAFARPLGGGLCDAMAEQPANHTCPKRGRKFI